MFSHGEPSRRQESWGFDETKLRDVRPERWETEQIREAEARKMLVQLGSPDEKLFYLSFPPSAKSYGRIGGGGRGSDIDDDDEAKKRARRR